MDKSSFQIKLLQKEDITQILISDFKILLTQLGVKHMPELSFEKISELISIKDNYIFVAQNQAKDTVGLLVMSGLHAISGTKFWIEDVIVEEKSRGNGLGVLLVEFALGLAKSKGITHINLTCKPERVAANAVYQKIGFQPNKTNYYRYTIKD